MRKIGGIAKVQTAKNPMNKTEIEQSLARSQSMLALLSDFRAFDWIKEYKYPTVMHDQMKGLLAKYENV